MPDKDITLTAKWSGFEYMIFFDPGKGKCSLSTLSVNCGEDIGELPKPVRTGYLFMGWYDGDNTLYTESSEMPDHDLELKAEWKKVSEYARKISLKESILTLGTGMTYRVEFTTEPEFTLDEFKWSSSDAKIASVDKNGVITAKGAGKVMIKLSGKNKYASLEVTVKPMVKELISAYKSRDLNVSQSVALKITYSGYAGNLTYLSSDQNIVSVSDDGIMTAKGKGSATITVKAENDVSTQIAVTVR